MQPETPPPAPGADPVRETLDRLRAGLDRKAYENWIDGKVRLAAADDELTVGVGSPFLLAWLQRQFGVAFRDAARGAIGPSARVRFVVDARLTPAVGQAARKPEAASPPTLAIETPPAEPAAPANRPRRFAELADFLAGPQSELAVAATLRFCEAPNAFPGPLYLYGGVGLGKTHLLEGVVRRLRGAGPAQVVYLTAEAFANYFTDALRGRTLPAFRARFRSVDVLLVDDVDFLDGKRGLQEEFLHTLQQLHTRGRTAVLAADRHPKLLTGTSDELATRFLAGTVCRLDPPDFETRMRILARKSSRLAVPPTPAALDYVARRFRGNVRELEGALNCLDVYGGMSGRPAAVSAARRLLCDLERDGTKAIRVADVEQAVCEFFGVQPEELRSDRRGRSISQPRMVAMYLARKHTPAAYSEIGAHFGGRNHSTVIAAEKKVRLLLAAGPLPSASDDPQPLGQAVATIEARLKAV